MLVLSNSIDQTLNPGQSATFDVEVLHTGSGECHRPGSGAVGLKSKRGVYRLVFSGNIGAVAPGEAQIAIQYDGSPLLETTAISQTATAGDLNNVCTGTLVITCCCDGGVVTVANTGTDQITLGARPRLEIEQVVQEAY